MAPAILNMVAILNKDSHHYLLLSHHYLLLAILNKYYTNLNTIIYYYHIFFIIITSLFITILNKDSHHYWCASGSYPHCCQRTESGWRWRRWCSRGVEGGHNNGGAKWGQREAGEGRPWGARRRKRKTEWN